MFALVAAAAVAAGNTAGTKPHVLFVLADDLGWANVGWHRDPPTPEVQTPILNQLVETGIELNRFYTWKACSPTRSALQTGRYPLHVNMHNADPLLYNASSASGVGAGIPRNMTGLGLKMKAGGYRTVMAGKWDAGMATPTHTPFGRGYDSALCYFHHANDYWTSTAGGPCPDGRNGKTYNGVDLYDTHQPGWGLNTTAHGHYGRNNTEYEEALFHRRLSAEISAHDPTAQPLFVLYAAHLVHLPYQVPQNYLDRMSKAGGGPFYNSTSQDNMRMIYHAMVKYLDDAVGMLVSEFRGKNMWDNTLVWFCSDNGGPVYVGGNNYPMRGGKYSEFEGGVRVSSFVSGGAIPPKRRGLKSEALMSVADVYTTLSSIAGVNPTDTEAAAAGLPAIDGLDMSPVFFGEDPATVSVGPRTEVPLTPLSGSDLNNLAAYDAQVAAYNMNRMHQANDGAGRRSARSTPAWDVHMNATCHNPTAIAHLKPITLSQCEVACGAKPDCLSFQYANHKQWCNLQNTSTFVHPTANSDDYDCVCRGPCPPAPPGPAPPAPPGPGPPSPPKPPKTPTCYKVEQCYLSGNAVPAPIAVLKDVQLNDCCTYCDAKNGTDGKPQCAISVFHSANHSSGAGGSCSLYTKDALPSQAVYTGLDHSMCWLPSAVNPPPKPILLNSAAIVVGNMKLVVGKAISMAIFTGPHFPNASTPDTDQTDEVRPGEWGGGYKVPSFDCSTPIKMGCLFNLTDDPTEHNDLCMALPDVATELLARLRNYSLAAFDPDRGPIQQAGCVQMEGPNKGFFGPWLELD